MRPALTPGDSTPAPRSGNQYGRRRSELVVRRVRETFFVQPFVAEPWGLQPGLASQHDTEVEARARAELVSRIYDGVAVIALETFDGGAERVVATFGDVPGVTFAVAA